VFALLSLVSHKHHQIVLVIAWARIQPTPPAHIPVLSLEEACSVVWVIFFFHFLRMGEGCCKTE